MPIRSSTILIMALTAALAGCKSHDLDETGGLRITRSACPAVAVPAYTGDITLFSPPASRDASAIDVVATLTQLRGNCSDVPGTDLRTSASFAVLARRTNPAGARDVVLPYFLTVVRGGDVVVSKAIGRVAVHFADGQLRAQTTGAGDATVSRALASLPAEVNAKITRQRKAGEIDAAVDPMSDPKVREAVRGASFELLVGFQLTDEQLAYNATR